MLFKKKKNDLKIQDVSADCPDYNGQEDQPDKKKRRKAKKSRMRKIRAKKRNPFLVLCLLLLFVGAAGAGIYFVGLPLIFGSSPVYVERVSSIMGMGSGNGSVNRYAGIVESQGEWSVTLDGGKRVKEVYVKEGDNVVIGDKLFSYDKEELKLQLEQAELELEQMESEIQAAKSQIRALEIQKEGASSSEELEIEIQIQSLKANNKKREYDIKNQNSAIESLKKAVDNTVVKSELAGVVKRVDQSVVNGTAFGETEFITILSTGDYRIKAAVNEQNQWSVEEGTKVIVRSRVDKMKTWTGQILTIDTNQPQEDGASYTDSSNLHASSSYPFYVQLDSSEGLILGQHVYIEPDKGQDVKKDGIWLSGYYFIQEEGKTYVWAQNSLGLLEKREITLGTFQEELGQYQVLAGLEKGDYIAFPLEDMREGMRTTRETQAENGIQDGSGKDEDQFQLNDDSFQEFEDNKGNDGNPDDMGPVGSIHEPLEVVL